MKEIRGKIAVVTGAGSGIGRATAKALAAIGARLVLADRQADRIESLEAEIRSAGGEAWHYVVDVSSRDQMQAFAEWAEGECGPVEILFNNAGVALAAEWIDTSLDDMNWIMDINFWGVMHGIHFFLPAMKERQSGHIVNTASAVGICPAPGMGAYCVTKSAIVALSESLRIELRPYQIGVSVICPGIINTAIVSEARFREKEEFAATQAGTVEFYRKRGWPPERVANSVLSAIRRNRGIVPVGPETWASWYLKRLSQPMYEWGLRLFWSRVKKSSGTRPGV